MDYLGHPDIEQWLISRNKSDFPGQKDYAKIYSLTKDAMDAGVHSEIKAVVAQLSPSIFLNNHGASHVSTTINRTSKILSSDHIKLSPYESFILLMAIQLHDTGHLINGRNGHESTVSTIITKIFSKSSGVGGIDTVEKTIIYKIIKAHSGKDDPIGRLELFDPVMGEQVRTRLLAAILRLSDELADDCLRASAFMLETGNPAITDDSKMFHLFSMSLKSCTISHESHEIVERFLLSKENVINPVHSSNNDKFLLDEIYDRTMKTFTEILYCNRFFNEYIRITRLSVVIDFIDDDSLEPFYDRISYRLEECGYPSVHESIFDIDSSLVKDGERIDGKYLKNIIEYAG